MADTFKDFVSKWSQPAIWITLVTSIIYGIIWLVQLNVATLDGAIERTQILMELREIRNDVSRQAINDAKTAAVLESLVRTVDNLEQRMTRNESWISDNSNHKHAE